MAGLEGVEMAEAAAAAAAAAAWLDPEMVAEEASWVATEVGPLARVHLEVERSVVAHRARWGSPVLVAIVEATTAVLEA
eukprot:2656518-Prymnesium_polylepis.1